MIEIGETVANLDDKEWSALLKFQTAFENFDSGYGHDSNENSISIWHYHSFREPNVCLAWLQMELSRVAKSKVSILDFR